MRKVLISLLLAGVAATPAIAGPFDWSDRHQAHENRQQAQQQNGQSRDDNRQARAERPAFVPQQREQLQQREQFQARQQFDQQARQQQVNAANAERFARANRGNFAGGGGGNYYAPRQRAVPQQPYAQPQGDWRGQRQDMRQQMRQQRIDERQQRIDERQLRQSARPVPNVMRAPSPLVVSNVPRPGTQPPLRAEGRRTPEVHWNTGWRDNDRYDWRDYRRHHRSRFHLGFYYDPYGWGYSPFQIGWRLWPGYYQSQFWINDPWDYRLPFAPPGYVWVRYFNDAMLVDTWSGTVVDVIPGFFW
jgi:hypothetical protein